MWTSSISNKKQWTSIFGESHSPAKMCISYARFEGNCIYLKLHSEIEQAFAPKKWLEKQYNEYEFGIYINNVKDIKVENFSFTGVARISITKNDQIYKFKLEINDSCSATFKAESITIANIKAYRNDGAI